MERLFAVVLLFLIIFTEGCGSDSTSNPPSNSRVTGSWTWIAGDNTDSQPGSYGTMGTPSPFNKPGARSGAVSWTDGSGNMWLFGGGGYNDLWRWDGTNWTWINGPSTGAVLPNYGTKGVAAATNIPGGRSDAVSWVDTFGNFWLFGGQGMDNSGTDGFLNDLWRWDGTNWTWIAGDALVGQAGVYGTKGVAAAGNKPGARSGAVSWSDSSGALWLFGGLGYDINGNWYKLNDLWKWDGTTWTWVSGGNVVGQPGNYGVKGVPATANMPGSREYAVALVDRNGNFWLFGGTGQGKAGAGNSGILNDLWRWDGTNWTWIAGDDAPSYSAVYGAKGIPAPTNKIGGRARAVAWVDANGYFWFFGGDGTDANGVTGSSLNDLWRWDGANWTWVAGDSSSAQGGVYGTKGTSGANNTPGARSRSVAWLDRSGNLWLFGGYGYTNTQWPGYLNDLWRFQ